MRQPKRQKQQEKLEDLIRDLERDLSEGKNQVASLEETYKRLEECERLCQELANENRRLVAETAVWQERSARAEESEKQVKALQLQLETLQGELGRAVAHNREIEQGTTANTSPALAPSKLNTVATDITGYTVGVAQAARSWIRENRRVAAGLVGVLVIALAAVLVLGRSVPEKPDRPPTPFANRGASVESAQRAAVKQDGSSAPRIRGVFQTIRPTRVYSEPDEASNLVAEIGKGTRVNVVSSQNGWLEIHSRHGRPPGFIRHEAAERLASN